MFVYFRVMSGRNTNRGQIGPNGGIPALLVQAETPQPNNDNLRLPALPSQRSVLANGKTTQNGYNEKSLFATPRAPGPGPNGIFNGRSNKNGIFQDFYKKNCSTWLKISLGFLDFFLFSMGIFVCLYFKIMFKLCIKIYHLLLEK